MSLKAQLEAIIYAAETPITTEQMVQLVKESAIAGGAAMALKTSAATSGTDAGKTRLGKIAVAAQMALCVVLLVGAGPLLEHYREQVAHGALAARALFTGDVAQVRDYAWAMDVGCLTPGSNEGFSNAVIEQMATGLPMIVTDVGGNAEAVAEGESGYVIAPGASAALAKALRRLRKLLSRVKPIAPHAVRCRLPAR